MMQLNTYDEDFEKEFREKFLKTIKDNIDSTQLSENGKNILRQANFNSLLTGTPDDMIRENSRLMRELQESETLGKKDLLTELGKIFDYNKEISKNKKISYWLAERTGRNTCTYCNRIYAFTVVGNSAGGKKYITRPQFDHWYPKSKYPLLALSLYNLIPSCPICNSSIKGNNVLHHDEYIHPYVKDDEALKFNFKVTLTQTESPEWDLKIVREPGSKIDRTIKALALEELYSGHTALEVKDLMEFNAAYEQGYIKDIFDNLLQIKKNGFSKIDIYRMLFGTEYEPDKFLDRPLSKLKRDVLEQIGLLPSSDS